MSYLQKASVHLLEEAARGWKRLLVAPELQNRGKKPIPHGSQSDQDQEVGQERLVPLPD